MDRIELNGRLASTKVIVSLKPPPKADNYIAPIEVCIQEKVGCFQLAADEAGELATLKAIYGPRADFGVYGVRTHDQLSAALEQRIDFVQLPYLDQGLLEEAVGAGVQTLVGARTPTEIIHAWWAGATAVTIYPGGSLSNDEIADLGDLFGDVDRFAFGNVERTTTDKWLASGARGVFLGDSLVANATRGGSLNDLRQRCRSTMDSIRRYLR
ncbi:beta/alpha barrel domain-containing protein [Parenemella sanctibonifatiensis]|uniref:Uncharacterized protein n=1 Tax=Parenemella sanctibonifatiensis TaxID=2016505 RepID=A0A255ED89_9ACTN|nr:hypothetical protein [Parenemella sanctibonifatiensis]OYN89497.1 hypothetical protein CGZ91_11465 [Parenemella sanctibonifatiensis]